MASARRERQRANRERGSKPPDMGDLLTAARPVYRPGWLARLRHRWATFALTRLG